MSSDEHSEHEKSATRSESGSNDEPAENNGSGAEEPVIEGSLVESIMSDFVGKEKSDKTDENENSNDSGKSSSRSSKKSSSRKTTDDSHHSSPRDSSHSDHESEKTNEEVMQSEHGNENEHEENDQSEETNHTQNEADSPKEEEEREESEGKRESETEERSRDIEEETQEMETTTQEDEQSEELRQKEEEEEQRKLEEEEQRRREEEQRQREEEQRKLEEEEQRRREEEEEERRREEERIKEAQRKEEERQRQHRERQLELQKLDMALTKMLKRKILPEYEIIGDVINYAKQKSEEMIRAEDYDAAAEIDVAIDVMFTSMEHESALRGDTSEARALRQRLNTCKGAEKSIERKYEYLVEQVKEEARQKMAELEAYHQEEQEIFQENWSRPEAKIPFSKPSAQLMEMRKQQQVMAHRHDFKIAKAIQNDARKLEEQEAAEGAKRFETALKTAYNQLIQRQQREVKCLIENVELQLSNLERMKEKELSTNNSTQRNLEMRLTMKQPSKRGTGLPQIKSRGAVSRVPSSTATAIAHRSRMRMPGGLRAPDMIRLELKTGEVRKILEGSRRASSRAPSSMQVTV